MGIEIETRRIISVCRVERKAYIDMLERLWRLRAGIGGVAVGGAQAELAVDVDVARAADGELAELHVVLGESARLVAEQVLDLRVERRRTQMQMQPQTQMKTQTQVQLRSWKWVCVRVRTFACTVRSSAPGRGPRSGRSCSPAPGCPAPRRTSRCPSRTTASPGTSGSLHKRPQAHVHGTLARASPTVLCTRRLARQTV